MNFFDGEILAFDKPYGTTSFKVVYTVRNTLTAKMDGRKIKVGHAGTLDPLATGLLLICTGRATKKIEELQMLDKEYEATLRLGATTASYDMEHLFIFHLFVQLRIAKVKRGQRFQRFSTCLYQ